MFIRHRQKIDMHIQKKEHTDTQIKKCVRNTVNYSFILTNTVSSFTMFLVFLSARNWRRIIDVACTYFKLMRVFWIVCGLDTRFGFVAYKANVSISEGRGTAPQIWSRECPTQCFCLVCAYVYRYVYVCVWYSAWGIIAFSSESDSAGESYQSGRDSGPGV